MSEKVTKNENFQNRPNMSFYGLKQTYAPNKTQRFMSGFGLSIFWVLRFWVWVFCKSFANFELKNKIKKLNKILWYGFEYKFKKIIK